MSPRHWLRAFHFPWRSPRRDVDEELAFHFETRIVDLRAMGLSPAEARRRAEEEFGDREEVWRELIGIDTRIAQREKRARWWEQWSQDVRDACRGIGRSPGFSVLTVMTIALGIGATTAVYTVADALLLRPIPYRDASRVFVVRRESPNPQGWPYGPMPIALVHAWQSNSPFIESSVAFQVGPGKGNVVIGQDTVQLRRAVVGDGFFDFAGVHPLIGRAFSKEEMLAEGPGAVLISEALWRRQYGASPGAVGQAVKVGSEERTIIGVVPARLMLPDFRVERPDIWVPMPDDQELLQQVMVRLKPGASRDEARTEAVARLKGSLLDKPWNRDIKWRIDMLRPDEKLPFRSTLTMLMGAVALLLLIAFINVAHLLLARGATRERELAVRHALGANRARLLRHLATESLVLGLAGGAGAAAIAWTGLRLIDALRPATVAALSYPSVNGNLVAISATLAIVAGLAVGLLSGLRVAHRNLTRSLRSSGSGGVRSSRFRAVLVIGEVGLSTTLLVGALLLIHAVFDLQRTDLGFDARGLYHVRFPGRSDESPEARMAFVSQLEEEAHRLPGTDAVSIMGGSFMWLVSAYETPEQPPVGEVSGTAVNEVRPGLFEMMGMGLLAGRNLDDGSAARNEVVVSSSLARAIWGAESPLGRQFRDARSKTTQGALEPWKTVIGVVPDAVNNVLDRDGAPAIYQALVMKGASGGVTLVIRMRTADAMARLRAFATAIRPQVPGSPTQVESIEETIRLSMAEPRFTMGVLVAFAGVAVLLAAVGLFGVISYSVKERTREIGVRMALGATRGGVARLVIGEGMRLAFLGLSLGLLGAVFASGLLDKMLYGVPQLDPFAFGAGALLLVMISGTACAIPMLQATSIDPIVATRAE